MKQHVTLPARRVSAIWSVSSRRGHYIGSLSGSGPGICKYSGEIIRTDTLTTDQPRWQRIKTIPLFLRLSARRPAYHHVIDVLAAYQPYTSDHRLSRKKKTVSCMRDDTGFKPADTGFRILQYQEELVLAAQLAGSGRNSIRKKWQTVRNGSKAAVKRNGMTGSSSGQRREPFPSD